MLTYVPHVLACAHHEGGLGMKVSAVALKRCIERIEVLEQKAGDGDDRLEKVEEWLDAQKGQSLQTPLTYTNDDEVIAEYDETSIMAQMYRHGMKSEAKEAEDGEVVAQSEDTPETAEVSDTASLTSLRESIDRVLSVCGGKPDFLKVDAIIDLVRPIVDRNKWLEGVNVETSHAMLSIKDQIHEQRERAEKAEASALEWGK